MIMNNYTAVHEFLLLGFPQIKGYNAIILFVLILIAYIMTLMINSMIIILVSTRQQLHSPMYFFIQQLSFIEIVFMTVTIPSMLRVIWLEGTTISIIGCIAQTYIYCAIGTTECHILTVMSFDRYLAICHPLRYSTIMNIKLQHSLVIYCWVFGLLITQVNLSFLCQLRFCGPNVINHFFCDIGPFVELSCSYTRALQLEIVFISIPIMVIPFILIVVSYICVFLTILRISSTTGRKKTFSTCSSLLSVVTVFYGTLITIYLVPANGHSLTVNKFIALLYIVITPLFNPFVYSLRSKEIRAIIGILLKTRCYGKNKT
ncbi:olfactory receptor 10A3-like [Pseudophryne corroboree]|uniref:olfactory receptor 10A3-like n=1 Tax=Pseudophryne corroboree TaxID=495146 RepID=UPI0030819097